MLPTDIIPRQQMERIASLPDLQVALHLLRYMHNSKLSYSLRLSSEQALQELAKEMMSVTRRALATMLDRKDIPEAAWQQALLSQGPGLGLANLPLMAPVMSQASLFEAGARLVQLDRATFAFLLVELLLGLDGLTASDQEFGGFPITHVKPVLQKRAFGADLREDCIPIDGVKSIQLV